MTWARRAASMAVCAATLSACDETPEEPITTTRLRRAGIAERGGVVTYRLLARDGDTSTVAPSALLVEPATAATVWPGTDSLRFERPGRAVVRVQGTSLADTVDVGEPPWIVFDADTAGNRDIWRMRLDGSERQRVTTEPSDDRDPTAAAGQVVFSSGRSGSIELWRVPLAGGAATRLTTTPESDQVPALSRDGARLVWLAGSGPSLVRIGGGDATASARFSPAITTSANNEEFSPAISPAGDRVAFATIRSGRLEVLVGAVGGASGSAARAIRDDSAFTSEPSFSPDGARLVVTRTVVRSGQADRNDLVVVTLATGAWSALTTSGTASQPAWLPDGRIVFRQPTPAGDRLFWVDAARPARVVAIPSGGLVPRAVDGVR